VLSEKKGDKLFLVAKPILRLSKLT